MGNGAARESGNETRPGKERPEPTTANPLRRTAESRVATQPNQIGSVRQAYLDRDSRVEGKLHFEKTARIDGQMSGEILARDLTIGADAHVTAQIRAVFVKIAGTFKGEITASQRIEVLASANISGTIRSPVLVMHEGAAFEGHCAMQVEKEKVSKPAGIPGDKFSAEQVQKQKESVCCSPTPSSQA